MALTVRVRAGKDDNAHADQTAIRTKHWLLEDPNSTDLISLCKLLAIGLLVSAAAAAAVLVGEDMLLHLAPFV